MRIIIDKRGVIPISRRSSKRDAIYGVLSSTKVHPTAEWIYAELKGTIPDLSLGTVYRNLARFKKEGTIMSVATVDGQERFDGCTRPHAHFICDRCHAVIDLEDIEIPIPRSLPGIVDACQLLYYGVCGLCAAKKESVHEREEIQ